MNQELFQSFTTLAYRPFIDPINVHRLWYWLLIPLALGIAVTYKAVRVGDMSHYVRQVAAMTAQIVGAMFLLGLGSYLLIQHVLPLILPVK
ncbi:MAG: hypothetical protein JSR77_18390 [Planctomycetes bacterium]|nr:hypothetical protein [Planctomycetota bacterium]